MLRQHHSGLWVSSKGIIRRRKYSEDNRGTDNGSGYLYVNVKCPSGFRSPVTNKERWIKKYVHILVMETFKPDGNSSMDVHHKNGVRNDNRLSNLERLSRGDNLEEAFIRRAKNRGVL